MAGILTNLIRRGGLRATTFAAIKAPFLPPHRYTSWIAFEQPNPALYTKPPGAPTGDKTPDSNNKNSATSNTLTTRRVGKATTAPATAVIPGGKQEISVSGKTAPPTITAGATTRRVSRYSTLSGPRDAQSGVWQNPWETQHWQLLSILLGMRESKWPDEAPTQPDPPRGDKIQGVVHANEGPLPRAAPSSGGRSGDGGSSKPPPPPLDFQHPLVGAANSLVEALRTCKRGPDAAVLRAHLRQVVLLHLEGVRSLSEARDAVRDLDVLFQTVNALQDESEHESQQHRRLRYLEHAEAAKRYYEFQLYSLREADEWRCQNRDAQEKDNGGETSGCEKTGEKDGKKKA
ncbi:hypothetical protein GGR52DRAFT_569089 [Hypoxylon sp. FL1284]|nr:hypothetical protein GGR52DRAFT_569089 [Hypoxylon sp. FL1284]